MFDFRKIELKDKVWIDECLSVSDFRAGEYSFSNNLAWQRLNDTVICHYKDFYLSLAFDNGNPYYLFPSGVKIDEKGQEKYLELFYDLKKYTENQGKQFVISTFTDDNLVWLNNAFGSDISINNDRDSSDYIYNAEDLISLSGKKYHGKRNHIKRFMDNNDWSYSDITENDLNECFMFTTKSYNNNDNNDFSAIVEQYAINTFFANFDYLGLKGGVLKSSGKIVGLTIGEQINSDTFIIHIEKALPEVQGAYPMICNQFAKANCADVKYINREEDLGLEGLRKSKLSYNPAFLLNKNVVTFNREI